MTEALSRAPLGVRIRDARLSLPAMLELVREAESLGYHSAWLPEGPGRDALTEAALLAQATHRIQIGTGIIPVFTRLPTVAAATALTAAQLVPGRIVLGIGIGHRQHMQAAHGVPFDKPVQRTREFAEIARALCQTGSVEYHGQIYDIDGFAMEDPVTEPVPIYIAALREGMLRMAGAVADGVLMNWVTLDYVPRAIELIHEGARAAGRDPSTIRVASYLRTCVCDDPERVERASRAQVARYGSMPYYRRYFQSIGFGDEAQAIEQAWQRDDAQAAAAIVSTRMLRAITIYGSADECRLRLDAYRQAGLDLPIIAPFPIDEPIEQTFERTLRGCAPAGG
ncbi:MAG: LLM class flavin-dependent oxidoreductase [Gammaproteobacteria bacterium]|nr:LLM class flavin-dependent oxidoreductase [Gammaproteobacteria bacterium]